MEPMWLAPRKTRHLSNSAWTRMHHSTTISTITRFVARGASTVWNQRQRKRATVEQKSSSTNYLKSRDLSLICNDMTVHYYVSVYLLTLLGTGTVASKQTNEMKMAADLKEKSQCFFSKSYCSRYNSNT